MLARAGCCRWCGRGSLVVKERDRVRVRDLPFAGRMTYLCWRKRRFWCEACARTFTETHPALPARQRVSARFRQHLFDRCLGGGAHAEVARDEHTSRYQVQTAFLLGGDELLARRQNGPPRRLSLDEAHHRRGRELATVVCDLDRRRVIDVVPGCTRRVIESWLTALPAEVRAGIEVVSIDPSDAYRHAIWAALLDARIVCDRSISSAARTPRWMPSAASASATPAPSDRRARDAAASMSGGAQSSTTHAIACSKRPNDSPSASAAGSVTCSAAIPCSPRRGD